MANNSAIRAMFEKEKRMAAVYAENVYDFALETRMFRFRR